MTKNIFFGSFIIYALFRKGRIWTTPGIMNHVLFGAISYTAAKGYSQFFYLNPYFAAAVRNN